MTHFPLPSNEEITIRFSAPEHFEAMRDLCLAVYPSSPPWTPELLASHHSIFPEGQFVAIENSSGRVAGMASSLIIDWDDYDLDQPWRDFTDHGTFRNHDTSTGRTLYGAEVMVHPELRGEGIGRLLYEARRNLVRHKKLVRIRAGARLRGYASHASRMSPLQYAGQVAAGEIFDPTISFQLREGFRIIAVVPGYLKHDPESLGNAALIEWLNPETATEETRATQERRVQRVLAARNVP